MHHHWGFHHWGHHGQACLRRSAMLETLSDEQISELADASGVPGGPGGDLHGDTERSGAHGIMGKA